MDLPNSLTTCFQPSEQMVPDYFAKASDLAKSTGMNSTCQQAASSSGSSGSVSAGVSTPFGSAGGQASYQQYQRDMAQSGCGQFALNLSNMMNDMSTINCAIQSTNNTVNSQQVSGNSITYTTIPLTPEEEQNKQKLSQQIIDAQATTMRLVANPNLSPEMQQKLIDLNNSSINVFQSILDTYSRDINITNSTITQSIVQRLAAAISITAEQAKTIAAKQATIAQATAENKLAQDLGVDALSPDSRSVIQQNIQNSQYFSDQNVQNTVNSIKLSQTGTNTLSLTVPGNINIKDSTISQSIVADMIVKALIGNATSTGLQIASQITSDAAGTIASDGKSKGSDALIAEMGKANAAAISAGKVDMGMGSLGIFIIVVILVLGFGVVKTGSAIMNNFIFVMALVSIVVGIIFVIKSGVGNKVIGSLLLLFGLVGMVFGGIMKMRLQATTMQ